MGAAHGAYPARAVLTTVRACESYASLFAGNTAEYCELYPIARDIGLSAMKPAFRGDEGIFGAALHGETGILAGG